MTQVNLPPGCYGFQCADGTRYTASKSGGSVAVEDHHATAIQTGQYGQADFISAAGALAFGTKKGRWCAPCLRVWNAWSVVCPKCGGDTEPWAPGDAPS